MCSRMFPKVLVVWRSLVDVRSEATRLLVGTVVSACEHHRGAAHLVESHNATENDTKVSLKLDKDGELVIMSS